MSEETSAEPESVIRVASATGRYSATIAHAGMALIAGVGTREADQSVLVPFVECEIGIDREGDDETLGTDDSGKHIEEHSILITLENAAFLAEAFSSAFAKLAPDLISLSQGPLKPVPDRIAYAIERLQQTKNNIAVLTDVLERFEV